MSTNVYPRWQYAVIDGEARKRIITSPDQEDPEVWKESPAQCAPPAEEKPACESCATLRGEIASMQKSFESAWKKQSKELEDLKKAYAKLEEERDALRKDLEKKAEAEGESGADETEGAPGRRSSRKAKDPKEPKDR